MIGGAEILLVQALGGGHLLVLWRPPGGALRGVAAPSWLKAKQVVQEAMAHLQAGPELEISGEAWAEALLVALRSILPKVNRGDES